MDGTCARDAVVRSIGKWVAAHGNYRNSAPVPKVPFDERVAKGYDAGSADMFDRAGVDTAVSFLADLAGDGASIRLRPQVSRHHAVHIYARVLDFHQQLDMRVQRLDEVLFFRLQLVVSVSADMYVAGRRDDSDVALELVYVSALLVGELP